MALSQDSTSFQPSELFAKILPCFRWPLAQLASKVSLDTSIPTMTSFILCYHYNVRIRQGSASGHLSSGISEHAASLDTVRHEQRSSEKRGHIYPTGSLTKGGHEAHRFPCCSARYWCPPSKPQRTRGAPRGAAPPHTAGHTGRVPRRFDRVKPLPEHRVGGDQSESKWWLRSAAWTAGCLGCPEMDRPMVGGWPIDWFCRKSSPETAAVYDQRQRVRQGGG